MLNNRVLFIGVGQCGNNIAEEFETMGYNAFAINTSDLDLSTVEVEHKYRVPGASGCARDRKKAISYFAKSYRKIFNTIDNSFDKQDMVYVVFSLGGGTGSGMSPLLIDSLSRKYYNKYFGAIVVLPSTDESLQCKANAIEAFNELIKIPNLRSVFILDNNYSKDKIDINRTFVKSFNSLMNISKPNKRGVIDDYEVEKLLTTKGMSIILQFKTTDKKMGYANSVFMQYEKGCEYLGVSVNNDIDINILENEFGKPKDIFTGYNDTDNIIIVTGMQYNMKYFNEMDAEIRRYTAKSTENNAEIKTIDTSDYKNLRVKIESVHEFDFDKLLAQYKK